MSDAPSPNAKSRRRRRRRKKSRAAAAVVASLPASQQQQRSQTTEASPPPPARPPEAPLVVRLDADDPFALSDADDDIALAPWEEEAAVADDEATPWPEEADDGAEDEPPQAPLELRRIVVEDDVDREAPAAPAKRLGAAAPANVRVPRIAVHASCDRAEIAEFLTAVAADPRLERAEITIERGGIDGAFERLARRASPDLLILDTTLPRAAVLERLDRLADVVFAETKVIVIGALNDISLFRELTARGVCDYIVPPLNPDDFVAALCGLYVSQDKALAGRVIAVVGARGGVGASSVARNIAWSIAERQQAGVALVDLDLSFSASSPVRNDAAAPCVAEALADPHAVDETFLERLITVKGQRLHVIPSRATLTREAEVDGDALATLVAQLRLTTPYVVLDAPHAWTPWLINTLAAADDAVIVAAPDLASLRNAKNMFEALKPLRGADAPAAIALSMVAMPRRPEIQVKDIAEVLSVAPIASIPYDASAFGVADAQDLMLSEAAPGSKAADAIDALAARLTGRKLMKAERRKAAPITPMAIEIPRTQNPYPAPPRRREEDRTEQKRGQAPLPETARKAEPAQPAKPRERAAPRGAPADAARTKTALVRYEAAMRHLRAGRTRKAVGLLRYAAENGVAAAQYRLARMYERGEGTAVDPGRALHWMARAAGDGHVRAMHDLGVLHVRDDAADDAAAFRWFRQAAEFGCANSQYNVGVLYQHGRGVRADAEEALFWFILAARQGDAVASGCAAEIAASLSLAKIEHTQARTERFQACTPSARANGDDVLQLEVRAEAA